MNFSRSHPPHIIIKQGPNFLESLQWISSGYPAAFPAHPPLFFRKKANEIRGFNPFYTAHKRMVSADILRRQNSGPGKLLEGRNIIIKVNLAIFTNIAQYLDIN